MVIGNPLDRLSADIAAAGRDLDDLDGPAEDFSDHLADAFREEVPVVSGFLQSTVYSDRSGVGVGAPYAGVVNDSNPYSDRAIARVDPADVFEEYVDDVLDAHLHSVYV